MEFKCYKCGYTRQWNPVEKGRSHPPDFVMEKYKDATQMFCNACWPLHPDDDEYVEG